MLKIRRISGPTFVRNWSVFCRAKIDSESCTIQLAKAATTASAQRFGTMILVRPKLFVGFATAIALCALAFAACLSLSRRDSATVRVKCCGGEVFVRPLCVDGRGLFGRDLILPTELLSDFQAPNKILGAEYEIENASSETIRLRYASTTCGCSAVKWNGAAVSTRDRIEMSPGSKGIVRLEISTPRQIACRLIRVGLELSAQHGVQPISLSCQTRVSPDIAASPNAMTFLIKSPADVSQQATIMVTRKFRCSTSSSNALVARVEGVPSCLKVVTVSRTRPATELEPGIKTESWEFRFRLNSGDALSDALGTRTVSLVFEGAAEGTDRIDVPLIIKRGYGVLSPLAIHFGVTRFGKVSQRRILLESADGDQFAVERVSANLPNVEAKTDLNELATRHWLDASFAAETAGEHRGKIAVQTTHPQTPLVTIDISAKVVEQ